MFLSIARFELLRLYRSPQSWLVMTLAVSAAALCFFLLVIRYLEYQRELQNIGVSVEVMMRYFNQVYVGVLLLTPLLSMNIIAADRRSGLLHFYLTTPTSMLALVGAKFIALGALIAVLLAVVCVLPLTLLWGASIDLGVWCSNTLGLGLFTLMHLALGLMASAIARGTISAVLLAYAVSITAWSLDWAARFDAEAGSLAALSTLTRIRGFSQGLLLQHDVLFFVIATLALFTGAVICTAMERYR